MYEFDNFLYPPVVDTFLPAFALKVPIGYEGYNFIFKYNDFVKIPIQINKFNAYEQIGFNRDTNSTLGVEVIVKSLDNINKLNIKNKEGLYRETIITELHKKSDGSYFIELPLAIYSFTPYYYYQIQFRFISNLIDNNEEEKNKVIFDSSNFVYLNDGIDSNFLSEWSSVLLIKPIIEPYVSFTQTDYIYDYYDNKIKAFTEELKLNGVLEWDIDGVITGEPETLKELKLRLVDENYNLLYEEKITSFTEGKTLSSFKPTLKYFLKNNTKYKLFLNFITTHLYEFNKEFQIESNFNWDYLPTVGFKLKTPKVGLNEKNEISVLLEWDSYFNEGDLEKDDEGFLKDMNIQFLLYRTDIKTNFSLWDKIAIINVPTLLAQNFTTFNDITAEYGVWYKYAVKVNYYETSYNRGYIASPAYYSENITPGFENKDIIIPNFEDLYLIDKENYLTIKLNPTISSFKITNSDSSIETIGSKFPFVRRNSNISYRQMQIGGLISRHMDDNLQFASGYTLFGYYEHLYYLYNSVYKINDYNDVIYERLFREKVLEFLTNGKPKLLKSPTEGNIIVKLTNVTLTPNQQLGRMLYSFTATAIEIAENNIDNLISLDIININKDFNITYTPSLSNENAEYAASLITDTYILENTIFLPDVFYDEGAKIDIITESDDSNVLTTFNSPLPI